MPNLRKFVEILQILPFTLKGISVVVERVQALLDKC